MPSPFPGMDPYLETPEIWPDVHHALISEIRTALNPGLRPEYVARVELRVYNLRNDDPAVELLIPEVRIEQTGKNGGKPRSANGASVAIAEPEAIPFLFQDEIKEARLEIRHRGTGKVVTIIEVMNPANKVRGSRGRESFMEKRRSTLESDVHWVEIDLLRAGTPSVTFLRPSDYRILVNRVKEKRRGQYWPVSIRQALPIIGIPLKGKDADVPLDLGAVRTAAYDLAGYDLSIDYRKDPDPPLTGADRKRAERLLRERGVR